MCTPPDLNLRYLSWVPIRPPNRNLRYQLNPSNLKPPITTIHRANSPQFTGQNSHPHHRSAHTVVLPFDRRCIPSATLTNQTNNFTTLELRKSWISALA